MQEVSVTQMLWVMLHQKSLTTKHGLAISRGYTQWLQEKFEHGRREGEGGSRAE